MILVFRSGSSPREVRHAEQHLRELGFEPHTLIGVERTVIAAIGDDRVTTKEHLESIPGVERVLPILAPYKLASKELNPETSVFQIGGQGARGKTPPAPPRQSPTSWTCR